MKPFVYYCVSCRWQRQNGSERMRRKEEVERLEG
jgi:hypothetical protein